MTTSLIQDDESLDANYGRLLVRAREIDRQELLGDAMCHWCSRLKRDHLHDGRCSSSALAHNFASTRAGEREKIDKALVMIEELRAI